MKSLVKTRRFAHALLAAAGAMSTVTAAAGDVKTIGAAGACLPGYFWEEASLVGSELTTSNDDLVFLICSLTRDLPQKGRLPSLQVHVFIDPNNPPEDSDYPVDCRAAALSVDGSGGRFMHIQSIPDNASGPHTLRFNNIRMVRQGQLVVACNLPKDGRLRAFRIEE